MLECQSPVWVKLPQPFWHGTLIICLRLGIIIADYAEEMSKGKPEDLTAHPFAHDIRVPVVETGFSPKPFLPSGSLPLTRPFIRFSSFTLFPFKAPPGPAKFFAGRRCPPPALLSKPTGGERPRRRAEAGWRKNAIQVRLLSLGTLTNFVSDVTRQTDTNRLA